MNKEKGIFIALIVFAVLYFVYNGGSTEGLEYEEYRVTNTEDFVCLDILDPSIDTYAEYVEVVDNCGIDKDYDETFFTDSFLAYRLYTTDSVCSYRHTYRIGDNDEVVVSIRKTSSGIKCYDDNHRLHLIEVLRVDYDTELIEVVPD